MTPTEPVLVRFGHSNGRIDDAAAELFRTSRADAVVVVVVDGARGDGATLIERYPIAPGVELHLQTLLMKVARQFGPEEDS